MQHLFDPQIKIIRNARAHGGVAAPVRRGDHSVEYFTGAREWCGEEEMNSLLQSDCGCLVTADGLGTGICWRRDKSNTQVT